MASNPRNVILAKTTKKGYGCWEDLTKLTLTDIRIYIYTYDVTLGRNIRYWGMVYWGIGVLRYWNLGVSGYWSIGVLCYGVVEYWSIGVLGYWGIGVLEYWSVGLLVPWGIGVSGRRGIGVSGYLKA